MTDTPDSNPRNLPAPPADALALPSTKESGWVANTRAIEFQDPDVAKAFVLCDYIIEGDGVRLAAKKAGLEPTKFYRILAAEEGESPLAKRYARARANRAFSRVEKVDDIIDDLRAGLIDHNTARIMIDAVKWQAGKENQGKFGEKVEVEQTGKVEHTIKFNRG